MTVGSDGAVSVLDNASPPPLNDESLDTPELNAQDPAREDHPHTYENVAAPGNDASLDTPFGSVATMNYDPNLNPAAPAWYHGSIMAEAAAEFLEVSFPPLPPLFLSLAWALIFPTTLTTSPARIFLGFPAGGTHTHTTHTHTHTTHTHHTHTHSLSLVSSCAMMC